MGQYPAGHTGENNPRLEIVKVRFVDSGDTMKCYLLALLLLAVVSEGQRRRRPRVHRGHVVGPVGFNLPDLTKLPSTQYECLENKRQSTQEKKFCRLQSKCLKKWRGHRSAKLNQRMQICKSQVKFLKFRLKFFFFSFLS